MCQGKEPQSADGVLKGSVVNQGLGMLCFSDFSTLSEAKKSERHLYISGLKGNYDPLAPNRTINSGRIAAKFVEWHLAGGAQPLAVTMNSGVCLAVEVDAAHIRRRLETGYCDEIASTLDEALHQVREACDQGQALSIGLIGNAAEIYPELVRRGIALTRHRSGWNARSGRPALACLDKRSGYGCCAAC